MVAMCEFPSVMSCVTGFRPVLSWLSQGTEYGLADIRRVDMERLLQEEAAELKTVPAPRNPAARESLGYLEDDTYIQLNDAPVNAGPGPDVRDAGDQPEDVEANKSEKLQLGLHIVTAEGKDIKRSNTGL